MFLDCFALTSLVDLNINNVMSKLLNLQPKPTPPPPPSLFRRSASPLIGWSMASDHERSDVRFWKQVAVPSCWCFPQRRSLTSAGSRRLWTCRAKHLQLSANHSAAKQVKTGIFKSTWFITCIIKHFFCVCCCEFSSKLTNTSKKNSSVLQFSNVYFSVSLNYHDMKSDKSATIRSKYSVLFFSFPKNININ